MACFVALRPYVAFLTAVLCIIRVNPFEFRRFTCRRSLCGPQAKPAVVWPISLLRFLRGSHSCTVHNHHPNGMHGTSMASCLQAGDQADTALLESNICTADQGSPPDAVCTAHAPCKATSEEKLSCCLHHTGGKPHNFYSTAALIAVTLCCTRCHLVAWMQNLATVCTWLSLGL